MIEQYLQPKDIILSQEKPQKPKQDNFYGNLFDKMKQNAQKTPPKKVTKRKKKGAAAAAPEPPAVEDEEMGDISIQAHKW